VGSIPSPRQAVSISKPSLLGVRKSSRLPDVPGAAFPYRKILGPIDFDDNSLDALERAAEITLHMNSKLAVLHVIVIVVATGDLPPARSLYEYQRKAADAKLADIGKEKLAGTQHELMV
jgi:universal stress protein family protein